MMGSGYFKLMGRFIKRTLLLIKAEGLGGLRKRMSLRLLQIHCFVVRRGADDLSTSEFTNPKANLEIHRVGIGDTNEIDELTRIDEWKIAKSVSLRMLKEGWRCYAVKHEGRIVASAWMTLNDEFQDDYLKRTFTLSPNEYYYWRGYCIPEYRGLGVIPFLGRYLECEVAPKNGRTRGLSLTRTRNKSMLRVWNKIGWFSVGRAGFVEILGIRLNYLWGREAFKATKRRVFLSIAW